MLVPPRFRFPWAATSGIIHRSAMEHRISPAPGSRHPAYNPLNRSSMQVTVEGCASINSLETTDHTATEDEAYTHPIQWNSAAASPTSPTQYPIVLHINAVTPITSCVLYEMVSLCPLQRGYRFLEWHQRINFWLGEGVHAQVTSSASPTPYT